MVQRCHPKDAVLIGVLSSAPALVPPEHPGLEDHRQRLCSEHTTNDEQKKLRPQEDRRGPECPADGQTPGVAHENLCWVSIEPEEANGRAAEAGEEDGELAGTRQIVDEQVFGRVNPTVEIGEDAKRHGCDGSQPGGEAIEAVGEIHRVARPGHYQRHPDDIQQRREHYDDILEDRHCGRARRHGGYEGVEQHVRAEHNAEGYLPDQLVTGYEAPGLSRHELQVVIHESDGSHPERRDGRHHYVANIEARPEHRGNEGADQEHDPTHGRRAPLCLVRAGGFSTDDLADVQPLEQSDDAGPYHEAQHNRGGRRPCSTEADVVEDVEDYELGAEGR